MTHPYHRAKPAYSTFEIPEVRHELLHSQRVLYTLCGCENERNAQGARDALSLFNELVAGGFEENLYDLSEDVHNVCTWALRQDSPPQTILEAATLFAGALIRHGHVAPAILILKRLADAPIKSRELKSVWAINSAIALKELTGTPGDDHWEVAIQQMPINRWKNYPSLAIGCRNLLRRLRLQNEEDGSLQSLLAAGPLAERAYSALSSPSVKATPFERSGEAVRLMVEIAYTQLASTEDAFGALDIPSATHIFEHAAMNAASNNTEEDLFPRTLTTLAQHYSMKGDREMARDAAVQAIAEFASCKYHDPEVIKALHLIFEANKDSSDNF
jgi:hypothetical protein